MRFRSEKAMEGFYQTAMTRPLQVYCFFSTCFVKTADRATECLSFESRLRPDSLFKVTTSETTAGIIDTTFLFYGRPFLPKEQKSKPGRRGRVTRASAKAKAKAKTKAKAKSSAAKPEDKEGPETKKAKK